MGDNKTAKLERRSPTRSPTPKRALETDIEVDMGSTDPPPATDTPGEPGFMTINTQDSLNLQLLRSDSEQERSRRKDLEDDVFTMNKKLADTTSLCNSNTKAIASVIQVFGAEGEHKDQVRILIIKKRTMTMRQFYGHFNSFQAHFQSNTGTLQITSAGPVWQVEVRSPAATQAVRDSVIAWTQSQSMQVTVIRGKSSISQARERICTGTTEAIASTFGIEKGKGKGKGSPQRLIIHWPNNRNQWKIFADGQLVAAGEIDMTKQVYSITLATNSLNGKHQELGHAIRE
jgi:hypothetical protein